MLRIKTLQRKRTAKMAELKKLRAKRKKLRADEAALEEKIDELEEVTPELEQQVDELTQEQTEVEDAIAELQDEIEQLDEEIAELEADVEEVEETIDEVEDELDDAGERSRHPSGRRSAQPRRRSASVNSRRFNCRSRCFDTRAERDAFYTRSEVKDFLARVRTLAGSGRRSVTGAELTIPEVVLDILRDNLHLYSKLIDKVRLRPVRGHARQQVIGDVPEGVWMEMAGALNELNFQISELEVDGFKVGGFIVADNFVLQDSDIALGEEILYMLGQSIGLAYDKAVVFGMGPSSKMPVGLVTRLAQTSKPDYWGANQSDWTDLHSANILKLNLTSKTGAEFFTPFLAALAKAEPRLTSGERCWIMNEKTRTDILIKSLGFNAAAAIVAGMENTMPILGGEIITEEFVPDYQVYGGYLSEYLSVEREGATFSRSDQPLFIQDKTVFKGTARYDGQPVRGEAFVAVSYNNSAVVTEMPFATDYANTRLNALICTAAEGNAAGQTVVTVAGSISAENDLYASVSGGLVPIIPGGRIGSTGWTKITSGTTPITAAAGVGITVVELDKDGRIVSAGYVASVPKTS